jgi:hypothetical protein
MAAKTKVEIDIDITPDMLAAGLQVLVDSGVLDRGAGRELPRVPMKSCRSWMAAAAESKAVIATTYQGRRLAIADRHSLAPLGACPSIRWISLACEGRIRFCLGA